MKSYLEFFINGSWVPSHSDERLLILDPSCEDAFAEVALAQERDVKLAVNAAKAAFDGWSNSVKKDRIALIENILIVYDKRSEDLAQAMSQEMGAPIDFARSAQVGIGRAHIEAFLNVLREFEFEHALRADAPNDLIRHEAVGVCALVTPWNWPMNQITLKVVAALAAGCTMVLKPSEESPVSAIIFAEILQEAGVPKGVFNLINGDGKGAGSLLTSHPDVDLVSFTGSTRAGVAITKACADSVKRVSLELGGKGANIIFADADENAVQRGAEHCFSNTGQSCNAPTRMLVERSRYAQAVTQAAEVADKLAVDLASKAGSHMGPLVNELQFDKVQDLISIGSSEGARLVSGGTGRPQGLNRGFFARPTVFADCSNDMTIMQQEVFGPVLCIMPFDSEEEAISIANDTPYGLTNYIQSSDADRLRRTARKLRSGMVELNGNYRSIGSPFGGYKQSGNGREGGTWGLEEFLEVKAISAWPNTAKAEPIIAAKRR